MEEKKELKEEIASLPYELIKALKEANSRMFKIAIALLIGWLFTTCLFVWYLNQYDFTSTTTTETYTQDGQGLNVIGDSNNIDKAVDDGADINTNGKN